MPCFLKLQSLKFLCLCLLLLILLFALCLAVHELLPVALHIVLVSATVVLITVSTLLGCHYIIFFVVFAEIDFRCTGINNTPFALLHDDSCRSLLLSLILSSAQLLFSALFKIALFCRLVGALFLLLIGVRVLILGFILILGLVLGLRFTLSLGMTLLFLILTWCRSLLFLLFGCLRNFRCLRLFRNFKIRIQTLDLIAQRNRVEEEIQFCLIQLTGMLFLLSSECTQNSQYILIGHTGVFC